MKYKISAYAKKEKVTYRTVWNWVKENKVKYETTANGHILILENEIETFNVAIYARVSSSENKDNLERQKERLISYCNAKGYKVSKVVTEIGSGLNDTRPKLESLLTDISINLIVVEHSDRLARFGLNYIQKLLALNNRNIEIVNVQTNEEHDLMQDFVSIITSFSSRLYGKRRSKRATEKLIKTLESEKE
jgi:predicted site-specific integrase-resolvase